MLKFSTYEQAFDELLENEGLKKKAAKSGISYGTLKKVYNRGMAAWRTGHRPGTTPQQWGMARVNSYIGKGKGTYYGADSDLSGKGKKKSKKESVNEAEYHPIKSSYHDDMAKAHASHAKRHSSEVHHGNHNDENEDMHHRAIDIHKQAHDAHKAAAAAASSLNQSKYKKAARDAHEYSKTAIGTTKDAGKFKTGQPKHKFPKLKLHTKLTKLNIKSESTVQELSKATLSRYIKAADKDKSKKHVQADIGKISRHSAHVNQIFRNRGIDMAKSKMKPARVPASETTVKEISKKTAANYIGKASRDAYFKGRDQGTVDAISAVGGSHPHQDYKKSPERKAAMRMRGIDRATKRLTKKEAMSDAEKKAHDAAIAAFKAKGGKIKKLKPGYAQGYHGKADPAAGMKGMMDKGDTRSIGTRKKVGSMK